MVVINDILLQKGMDYVTTSGIKVHHPSLEEIDSFGESNYYNAVNAIVATTYDYMIELENMGIDFVEMDNYELFLGLISEKEAMHNCRIFFGEYGFGYMQDSDNEDIYLVQEVTGAILDRLAYEEISTFVKRINMIPIKPPHDIENLKTKPFLKNMLLEDMKAKRQRRMYQLSNMRQSELSNNVRFVVWNNTVGYNYGNIWDLKIYQLHEGIVSLQKTDNYKNTMLGLYTGNVDGKKIDFESISWSSRMKIT